MMEEQYKETDITPFMDVINKELTALHNHIQHKALMAFATDFKDEYDSCIWVRIPAINLELDRLRAVYTRTFLTEKEVVENDCLKKGYMDELPKHSAETWQNIIKRLLITLHKEVDCSSNRDNIELFLLRALEGTYEVH